MASDKRRREPPPKNTFKEGPFNFKENTFKEKALKEETVCKPALRPQPNSARKDTASKPDHPPPEDEYGGGDIVSPEPAEPTEDDKPLP